MKEYPIPPIELIEDTSFPLYGKDLNISNIIEEIDKELIDDGYIPNNYTPNTKNIIDKYALIIPHDGGDIIMEYVGDRESMERYKLFKELFPNDFLYSPLSELEKMTFSPSSCVIFSLLNEIFPHEKFMSHGTSQEIPQEVQEVPQEVPSEVKEFIRRNHLVIDD